MRNVIFLISGLALVSLFASCMSGTPIVSRKSDNNKTFKVDYLFEHDGCRVYRFYDMGNFVYFTNCAGTVTAIKNDSTHQRIENNISVTYEKYGDPDKQ